MSHLKCQHAGSQFCTTATKRQRYQSLNPASSGTVPESATRVQKDLQEDLFYFFSCFTLYSFQICKHSLADLSTITEQMQQKGLLLLMTLYLAL